MRTRYLLPCQCGQEIPVQATQAGQKVTCSCGAELEVPTMLGLSRLQQVAEVPDAGPSASTWDIRHRLVLIGLLVTVTALGGALAVHLTRPVLPEIDTLPAMRTWIAWHDFREGIDAYTPQEEQYFRQLAIHRRWTIVLLIVAGLGMLVMASSLMIPRPRERGL